MIKVTGGWHGSAAVTQLAYPLGDVLLLALAIGGLAVLPRGLPALLHHRRRRAREPTRSVTCFNLLQPNSRFGYVANGAAWPISLTLLAIAAWILPANIEHARDRQDRRVHVAGVRRGASAW